MHNRLRHTRTLLLRLNNTTPEETPIINVRISIFLYYLEAIDKRVVTLERRTGETSTY
tara:strand:+ start:215 stop:388 length:174 start_codon:yes stop_codon:yes gene_type:complete